MGNTPTLFGLTGVAVWNYISRAWDSPPFGGAHMTAHVRLADIHHLFSCNIFEIFHSCLYLLCTCIYLQTVR